MPIYSYECPKCGSVKELLRKLSEKEELVSCDNDNELMKFIINGAHFVRKGAGIYSLDINSEKWGDYK